MQQILSNRKNVRQTALPASNAIKINVQQSTKHHPLLIEIYQSKQDRQNKNEVEKKSS